MINLSSKTRTRITRNCEIKITGEELRQLVNAYFVESRGVEESIPFEANITVHIPGGREEHGTVWLADWSNEDLDINDQHPIVIAWTEEEGSDE